MSCASRTCRTFALAVMTALVSTGCYHAVVDTGRPPSDQVVERQWAHSFLWGLVPPETVETAAQCANGVARVETVHSFLNQLASVLTWGIYSPMTIRATCAASGDDDANDADVLIPAAASADERISAFTDAVKLSAQRGAPVTVRFVAD